MKVFVIENKKGEIFNVENKTRFCKEFSLTPRLLDYTKGVSKNRPQEWHKEYKISEIVNFIESDDGEKVLWDNGVNGYFLKGLNEEKTKSKIVEDIIDEKYTHVSPNEEEVKSLQKELTKVHRQKQKLQDQLTLNKKIMREQFRYENMCDVVIANCKKHLKEGVPKVKEISSLSLVEESVLTISDVHIGQIIEETTNYFDYEVACIRLENIFSSFIQESNIRGITNVSILFLGDLIHCSSILKPDMAFSSEFGEIHSALKCYELLASQIDRLIPLYNKISLGSIIGNESRFNSHYNPSNLQKEAKNNLDVLIFTMLKERYSDTENVLFINEGDELESVVNINGKNIFMTHGNCKSINHKELDKSFINIKSRLEPIYGCLDIMVLGHIHSTAITHRTFRNASLAGSNSYSISLGFADSPISQNMLLINENRIIGFPLYCK